MLGWDDDFASGATTVAARDLWAHADAAPSDPHTGHTATLEPQAVAMYIFTRIAA